MADDVAVTPTASFTVAADDILGVHHQRVKVGFGIDGAYGDVNPTNALPVAGTVTVANGVSVSAQVSGTVTVNGTVTAANGVSVTIQQGASVSAVVSGTVTVAEALFTTVAQPAAASTALIVAVKAGASVTALVSGTVTVANGASVTIQQGASVSAVVSGTVTINGTVSNSGILFTIGAPTQASTAQIVVVKDQPYIPFVMMVSSTVGGSVGTTLLMTIWTGATLAGAGLTAYAVPAGQVLRLLNMQAVINSSAVTGGSVQLMVNAATAQGSLVSANQATIGRPLFLGMLVSAGPVAGSVVGAYADIPAATTIGVRNSAPTAMVIGYIVVQGYLF